MKLPMTGVWGLRKFFHENKILLYFESELKSMLGDLEFLFYQFFFDFIFELPDGWGLRTIIRNYLNLGLGLTYDIKNILVTLSDLNFGFKIVSMIWPHRKRRGIPFKKSLRLQKA